MPDPTDLRSLAQAILSGPWNEAARALEACRTGTWAAFVDSSAPPAPGFFGRGKYQNCLNRAKSLFAGPVDSTLEIIPAWSGANEDEEPSSEWHSMHVCLAADGMLNIEETGPHDRDARHVTDQRLVCRLRRWTTGSVVLTRSYSPDIALELRAGDFGVIKGEIVEVVESSALPGDPLPRPKLEVPPFSSWYEPRVSGLTPALARQIRKLSFSTDEEGATIDRPGLE